METVDKKQIISAKEPSSRLKVVYIIALLTIALLTLANDIIITGATMRQKEATELVYTAGRQRMLLQQTAIFSARYYRQGNPQDLESLKLTIDNLSNNFRFLTTSTKGQREELRQMSQDLHDLYYEGPFKLATAISEFLEKAAEYASMDPADKDGRRPLLEFISQSSTGALLEGLDDAMQFHQEEAMLELAKIQRLQFTLSAIIILVLLAEAVFIFRPLVRYVHNYSQTLLTIALKDPLTGLNNRRAFFEQAESELSRMQRHKYPVSVVLTDIDRFKSVNDTYGHDVGDDVLKHFALTLSESLRNEDIIGRIGGEEFAILLPETTAEQGLMLVERLRSKIETTPCEYLTEKNRKDMLAITASFGMITASDISNDDIESLLKKADKALYKAKEEGRNRVEQIKAEAA